MDLSVIVVSWNTRVLTLACLESLEAACAEHVRATGRRVEIVHVDNGSGDGTAEAVRRAHPDVVAVALPRNVGFAAGVNAGLEAASGGVLLLLNSDARIGADALEACVGRLERHPEVAIVGPQLLHPDGRLQNAAHAFPSALDELLPGFLIDVLMPGRRPAKRRVGDAPRPVDAVQGAALFVRRAVLDRLGPLCADYFFFLEETDLCWRARAAGLRVELLPAARVVHAAGSSSKRVDPARTRIEYHRSLYRFLGERRGPATRRLAIAARTLRGIVTVPVLFVLALVRSAARVRLQERAALLRWHLAGRPDDAGLAGAARAGRSDAGASAARSGEPSSSPLGDGSGVATRGR